mgnify:FL=1
MTIDDIHEIERYCIGSLILDNESFYLIETPLSVNHFICPKSRLIYEFILKCIERNETWDHILINSALRASDATTDWTAFTLECTDKIVSSAKIATYARKIIEFNSYMGFARTLDLAKKRLNIGNLNDSKLDLINYLSGSSDELGKEGFEDSRIGSIFDQYTLKIQNQNDTNRTLYLNSGYKDLDYLIEGFGPGSLNVIAARPGGGKSTIAMNIATNMAFDLINSNQRNSQYPIPFFALEMDKTELLKRIISTYTKINHSKIRKEDPEFIRGNIVKISEAKSALSKTNLTIFDRVRSCAEIRFHCNKMKARYGGVAAIIVDYLQIMVHNETKFSKADQIGETTIELKRIAQDFDCPLIVLSQLNRSIETREDRTPKLSDLRDSGSIESDSDCVLFVKNTTNPDDGTEYLEIDIAKNRSGKGEGRVKLIWDKETFALYNRDESNKNIYPDLYVKQKDFSLNH